MILPQIVIRINYWLIDPVCWFDPDLDHCCLLGLDPDPSDPDLDQYLIKKRNKTFNNNQVPIINGIILT